MPLISKSYILYDCFATLATILRGPFYESIKNDNQKFISS